MKSYIYQGISVLLALCLSGCFPLLFGAAAGGGAVVLTDRRSTAVQAIDHGLKVESERALRGEGERFSKVHVTVFNRRVLLTGVVSNLIQKQEAANLVLRTQHPDGVVNELRISASGVEESAIKDTAITSAVKAALLVARDVPSNSISVTTFAGVVYLLGLVTKKEGEAAAKAASKVVGVKEVAPAFEYIAELKKQAS